MDRKLVWSPEALEDLESIAAYIQKNSEFYARAIVTKILDAAKIIGNFPHAGRMVPELNDETIRERFIYSYRLVYKVEEQRVLIVAVIHGKRLLVEGMSERLGQRES
jgi:toxin ParE1/3/4